MLQLCFKTLNKRGYNDCYIDNIGMKIKTKISWVYTDKIIKLKSLKQNKQQSLRINLKMITIFYLV